MIVLLYLTLYNGDGKLPARPDCRAAITQAYHELATAVAPTQRRVLHLRFQTATTFQAPNQKIEQRAMLGGDLYIRGRRLYYKTPDLVVWQDDKVVCSVLQQQHIILLTRIPNSGEASNLPAMMIVQDSLIKQAAVQLCRQEQIGGQSQQHVRLGLPLRVARRTGLQTLDFYLATAPARLQRLVATYQPNHKAQQIALTFSKQEWLAAAPELTGEARGRVLDKQGRLLPAYRGYQLLDQTTASSHR